MYLLTSLTIKWDLSDFHRHQRAKENYEEMLKTTFIRSANRLEIAIKVAFNVIESANFTELHGFYDFTGNFELVIPAIG